MERSNVRQDVVDCEKFEARLLTKPSNVSSKAAANNLKTVIQGKYLTDMNAAATFREGVSIGTSSPASKASTIKKKSDSIKIVDAIIQTPRVDPHPCKKVVPILPPVHQFPPLQPPSIPKRVMKSESLPLLVKELLEEAEEKLHPPLFRFDVSPDAASHNWELLSNNNYNLEALLNPTKQCATSYGSEFKSSDKLEKLLKFHPRWLSLKDKLERGCEFPLEDFSEDLRKLDLEAAYKRGNHKSAEANEDFLANAIEKEISKGWMVIFPDNKYTDIPDLILNPMGVAEQLGVNAAGDFVNKKRITHDLSFPGAVSDESVNSRVIKDNLEPCMFGHTLLRVIHYIVNLRARHPRKKIWLRKEDFKSAYRRLHTRARTASRSAIRVKIKGIWYIILSLRLPFGGSPCPNDFCLMSDVITDTINDLLACSDWNHKEIHSAYFAKIPAAKPSDKSIAFGQAKPFSISMPDEDSGKADCFIDDIISCCVDIGDNLERLMTAPCTILHAVATNSSGDSSIKRDNLIADDKNEAEGGPEEVKICLGWTLDTRQLIVSLPLHKYKAWDAQIASVLSQKSVSEEVLASVLGRLENVAIIVSMLGHFLNNIRHLQLKAERKQHNVMIGSRVKEDLRLARCFLSRAQQGISMNLLTFREPTIVHIGDASEHGLGAFASHGRAWRYLIPEHLRGRAHINLLEFLTQLISVWIDILENKTSKEDCILCMGDSTAAMGWLRRSNLRETDEDDKDWEVKQQVARKLANLVLDSGTVLYKQWFAGKLNVVADSLSRDLYYLSPNTHKQFLHLVASPQLPANFVIKAVPTEICSFITLMLEQLPVKKLRLSPQKPSEIALGNVGILSSLASGYTMHCSSMGCPDFNKTSSCQLSDKQSEKLLSHQQIMDSWWKEQSHPPCHMWHRPLGQATGLTQDWTETTKLASFFKSNAEVTRMKTDPGRNRRPYL